MLPRLVRWLIMSLLVLWLLIQSTQPETRRRHRRRYGGIFSGPSGCEPVRLELCRGAMPYSRTRMPNLLHHATQRNARLVLDQYQSLIDTRCGVQTTDEQDHLVFYLCAVFAPICPAGFYLDDVGGSEPGRLRHRRLLPLPASDEEGTIPPCRAVCETARAGCEPVMRRYNVSWPAELDCTRWPTQNRGICISPASISMLSNNSGDDSVAGQQLFFQNCNTCVYQSVAFAWSAHLPFFCISRPIRHGPQRSLRSLSHLCHAATETFPTVPLKSGMTYHFRSDSPVHSLDIFKRNLKLTTLPITDHLATASSASGSTLST